MATFFLGAIAFLLLIISCDLSTIADALKENKHDADKRSSETGFINGLGEQIENCRMEEHKGKWIKDIYGNVVCSECRANRRDNRIGHIAFCNCCGAKMEVEEC